MGFADAVRACLHRYATFAGRARRSEFWWFVLFLALGGIVASVLDGLIFGGGPGGFGVLSPLFSLAVLLPNLAVTARRLHDTGRTGWWMLLGAVPLIGPLVLIFFLIQDSEPVSNRHGPPPKTPRDAEPTGSSNVPTVGRD